MTKQTKLIIGGVIAILLVFGLVQSCNTKTVHVVHHTAKH